MNPRLEMMSIGKIKGADHNPKEHDLPSVSASIRRFGFVDFPTVNDATGKLVEGHGRIEALKLIKREGPKPDIDKAWPPVNVAAKGRSWSCPVVRGMSWSSDSEAEAYLAAHNQTTIAAGWDEDGLVLLLRRVNETEQQFEGLGFDDSYVQGLLTSASGGAVEPPSTSSGVSEGAAPETPAEPVTQLGDVWKLGDHWLMCDDSHETEAVAALIDGDPVDLGLHDPPYGISIVQRDGKIGSDHETCLAEHNVYAPVLGDDKPYHPQHLLTLGAKTTVVFGANYFHDELPRSGAWLAWDKGRPEGMDFSDVELAWTDADKRAIKCYRVVWNGMIREGESGARVHPTQKPIKLCMQIIEDYTKPGEVVLDLFAGGGSTLLACEHTGRKCRAMELSPAYCDIIISRWESLTGEKAVRVDC